MKHRILYYIILKFFKKFTENIQSHSFLCEKQKFAQKWMRKQNEKLSDIFAIIDRWLLKGVIQEKDTNQNS
jgi:hypothetical protein